MKRPLFQVAGPHNEFVLTAWIAYKPPSPVERKPFYGLMIKWPWFWGAVGLQITWGCRGRRGIHFVSEWRDNNPFRAPSLKNYVHPGHQESV